MERKRTIQETRDSFIEDIESELKKDARDIDGDFIDRRVDGLYELEGLEPPRIGDGALAAAARAIRSRAAWRQNNRLAQEGRKRRFTRRALRGAMAACCLALFSFSANYLSALVTGSCLPSKVGIKICCGTRFCACEKITEAEEETASGGN
jgi:hypothetical protein